MYLCIVSCAAASCALRLGPKTHWNVIQRWLKRWLKIAMWASSSATPAKLERRQQRQQGVGFLEGRGSEASQYCMRTRYYTGSFKINAQIVRFPTVSKYYRISNHIELLPDFRTRGIIARFPAVSKYRQISNHVEPLSDFQMCRIIVRF